MGFPKTVRKIEVCQQIAYGLTTDLVFSVITTHKNAIREYAYIVHDMEGEPHIHLLMWFSSPQQVEAVVKWFGGVIHIEHLETIKKDESACAYLTHANKPLKYQYDISSVVTNIPNFASVTEEAKKLSNVQLIIDDILAGRITEAQFYSLENGSLYVKHKNKIDTAFEFYYDCMRKEVLRLEKKIDVIFCDGDSRTGKTSYWVEQCRNMGKTYCKSSSSNDILQDYRNEDVLILDDLRDDALKLSDFLKFTDPNYRSTTQSRYHNKCFVGDTIVITTTKPLNDWYVNCKEEQIVQFTARIKVWFHFTKDTITVHQHKGGKDTEDFDNGLNMPNPMKPMYSDMRMQYGAFLGAIIGEMEVRDVDWVKDYKYNSSKSNS